MKRKIIKIMVVLTALFLLSCGCTRKEDVVLSLAGSSTQERSSDEPALKEPALKEPAAADDEVCAEPDYAYVHIGGAVVTPGVYKVAADSRVYEVIELAGGFLPEACTDYMNQAQPVTDGMKLIIPTLQEVEAGSVPATERGSTYTQGAVQTADTAQTALVNINTASKEALCTLPGIGEARAEDIIRYREQNGGFRDISDIMQVDGIKDKAYAKIKEYITVK